MSEETSPVANNSAEESSVSVGRSLERSSIHDLADSVLKAILRKNKDITVIISSTEGICLTSTLRTKDALEQSACILNFTDKAKVLTRKLLNEELSYVRIRGTTNEVVVTFDEPLEIITIQEDTT